MSRVEVSTQIAAPPERVWDLIGDPTRMGEWSPECKALAWIGDSTAPAIGAKFKGRNRNGWRRWTTRCTIVSYQPGREIAWDVDFFGIPVSRWGYQIEAGDRGSRCRVVESFRDRRSRSFTAVSPVARGVKDVEAHNRASMEHTLGQIKTAAES